MMEQQEIEEKTLSWKVKKVGEGDYRVIRPHKFIMIVDEYDTGAFSNRVLAEEHAMTLNRDEKRKEQK